MSAKFSFATGVPTEPDVRKIRDAVGVPQPGELVPYERIADLIGVQPGSSRFRTVVSAWRKAMERDHNLISRAVTKCGYEFLTAPQRLHYCGANLKSGMKRVTRAGAVAERTDRTDLDENGKKLHDHLTRVAVALRQAAAEASRRITEAPKLK